MIARLKVWAAALGVGIALLVASWFGGRKSAQIDANLEKAEDYVDTSKRISAVDINDLDAAREFLRTRNKQ